MEVNKSNYSEQCRKIEKNKKQNKFQNTFANIMGANNWLDAQAIYPEETERIDNGEFEGT